MKAVLMSIQPTWCEKIASGEKTIEVRKSRPKLETPFKVYIYATWNGSKKEILVKQDGLLYCEDWRKANGLQRASGKVIGEFVCDRIDKYTAEFVNDGDCYEDVRRVWVDDDGEDDFEIVTGNDRDNPEDCELLEKSCLSYAELKKYIGENFHDIPFYGWHISDLKIYDKPKELSEFYSVAESGSDCCSGCIYHETPLEEMPCKTCTGERKYLYRAPQSWCFVEM